MGEPCTQGSSSCLDHSNSLLSASASLGFPDTSTIARAPGCLHIILAVLERSLWALIHVKILFEAAFIIHSPID